MNSARTWWMKSWEESKRKVEERERRNARLLPTWRTQKRRRLLVKITIVGFLLLIAGAAIVSQERIWIFTGLWPAGFLIGGTAFMMLRTLVGGMSTAFSSNLDEREREWRNRVSYAGFQIFTTLMILALIYLAFGSKLGLPTDNGVIVLATLITIGTATPTLVLGWTLPDDDPDDFKV